MIYGRKTDSGKQRTYCLCNCDCGNTVERLMDSLNEDVLCSCGCARKEIADKLSIDVVGQKFGKLTVLEEYADITPRKLKCQCDCGNIVILTKSEVTSFGIQSCGCYKYERISEVNTKDWTGYISDYGVKIIKQHSKNSHGQWLWECECLCGEHFICLPARIQSGHTTSCGCRNKSSREFFISNYLKENNIEFEEQYIFNDCIYKSYLKYDFALFKNGKVFLLIEYDGKQHFEPVKWFGGQDAFNERIIRDNIKNKYCEEHQIPLLRLKYNLTNEQIIQKIANIIYP